MTKMYVQEFAGLAPTSMNDSLPVPAEPPLASYIVDYTTAVANGPKYNSSTKFLTVESDAICSARFDGAVATITDRRFIAGTNPLLISVAGVPAGNVSAVTNT